MSERDELVGRALLWLSQMAKRYRHEGQCTNGPRSLCVSDQDHKNATALVESLCAEIARLRASTPEGSETEDRTMDGCDPARATYTRGISPPTHDLEALREALDEISKREHSDTCQYVLAEKPEYECNCHVHIARRALSQHVGGER